MVAAPKMLAILESLEHWSDMAGEFSADGFTDAIYAVLAEVREHIVQLIGPDGNTVKTLTRYKK